MLTHDQHSDQLKLEQLLSPYVVRRRGCSYIRMRKSVKLEPDETGQFLDLSDLIDAIWDRKL